MKRKLYIAIPILLVAGLIAGFFGLFNHFPSVTLNAILIDSGVIFYSIDPSEGRTATPGVALFHDWPILGQTVLSSQDRKALTDSLRRVARGASILDEAACFNPRHGITATDSIGTYDVLVCFECGQAVIYFSDGRTKKIPIHGSPDVLNQLLTAAHVPLARQK